jgi:hypothetical protein
MSAPLFATSPTAEISFCFGKNGLYNLLYLFSPRNKVVKYDRD